MLLEIEIQKRVSSTESSLTENDTSLKGVRIIVEAATPIVIKTNTIPFIWKYKGLIENSKETRQTNVKFNEAIKYDKQSILDNCFDYSENAIIYEFKNKKYLSNRSSGTFLITTRLIMPPLKRTYVLGGNSIRKGKLDSLTVKELQERCIKRKLKYSGLRKAELIATLRKG